MDIKEIISEIREFLLTTFSKIDSWFDKDAELRNYKPIGGGWTIDQILEHIVLTNHFLLILIDKGTGKALANTSNLDFLAQHGQRHITQMEKNETEFNHD